MYEIKTEDVSGDFSKDKGMFDFSNYSAETKYHDDSNKLVAAKMKDKRGGVTIKEFLELKLKVYSFLTVGSSEQKNTKGVDKNVVATISHGE